MIASLRRRTAAAISGRGARALAGWLTAAFLVLACHPRTKGEASPDANQSIEECDAYVAAYQHCIGTLGTESVARARGEQARAGLAAQLRTAQSEPARAALKTQCAANLSHLKATCH
jgi:hypothetical protein